MEFQNTQAENRLYTMEEYLDFEMASESKHEYEAGKIVSMAGGTPRHSLITANMIFCLNLSAKKNGKDCRVFSSDAIIKSDKANSFLYPDASVVCGDIEYGDEKKCQSPIPYLSLR